MGARLGSNNLAISLRRAAVEGSTSTSAVGEMARGRRVFEDEDEVEEEEVEDETEVEVDDGEVVAVGPGARKHISTNDAAERKE